MKLKCKILFFNLLFLFGGVLCGVAQIETTSLLVSGITNAGEGDYYLTTDTGELYVGLSSGLLNPVGNVTAKGANTGDLLIWNTTTSKWEASTAGAGWGLTGNSGTTAGTNFIGTTDNQDLVFKTNNLESGRVSVSQQSTAFGHNSTAGFQGTAIGFDASATANNSTAIGHNTSATQANTVILGNNANVGIGTNTPRAKLEVNGSLIEGRDKSDFGNLPVLGSCKISHGIATYFTYENNSTDYFHIKMPYKKAVDNKMYHIHVTGYAYASRGVIDLTYVGYVYAPRTNIVNTQIINNGDPSIVATQYYGSDNHLYLRFKTTNIYYNSFRVDSMDVGNGRVLKNGDIQIIKSASLRL